MGRIHWPGHSRAAVAITDSSSRTLPGQCQALRRGKDAAGESAERLVVLLAPLAEEKTREQRDIVLAVAQRGHREADGAEMTDKIGAKGTGGGQTAKGLRRSGDQLQRSGGFAGAKAFVRDALEEIAELALLFGRELVDAGEIYKAGTGFSPPGLGRLEEGGGDAGNKGAGGRRTELMESAGGEHLARTLFAFDIDQTKVRSRAPDARKQLLHDETAARHGAEHPSRGVNRVGFKGFEIEAAGVRRLRGLIRVDLCEVHRASPVLLRNLSADGDAG